LVSLGQKGRKAIKAQRGQLVLPGWTDRRDRKATLAIRARLVKLGQLVRKATPDRKGPLVPTVQPGRREALARRGFKAQLARLVRTARFQGIQGPAGEQGPQGIQGETGPAGTGADPWTYIKLANDFTTSSATAVDITGLAFTPAANLQYEFEACLFMRTATATVGAKPGLAWPGGVTDAVADAYASISATVEVQAHGNANASIIAASTALANTTQSYSGRLFGSMKMGGSPTGTLKVQLASETAGTNVIAKAGSFLKYRTI
jgi:hypothetical protein